MHYSHRMWFAGIGSHTKKANQLPAKTRLVTEIQLVTEV
jgi:hypothetical protein